MTLHLLNPLCTMLQSAVLHLFSLSPLEGLQPLHLHLLCVELLFEGLLLKLHSFELVLLQHLHPCLFQCLPQQHLHHGLALFVEIKKFILLDLGRGVLANLT